jgi:cation diffusion facilitator CzcD-associated flavoprotein CzcO
MARPPALQPELDAVIIGAGFSGLGMAICLKQDAPQRQFMLFEKSAGVGGTWRENTYPGVACDVPSHLYSFSFDQKPDWSRMYAPGPEIWAYLEACADKHGVRPHLRFNMAVTGLTWEEAHGFWRVRLSTGENVTARSVVCGAGGLHVPAFPDAPGRERFAGPAMHTAQWRDDVDFAGKTVAVVGTGASAIQVVPEVAKTAAKVLVFQRTPPWILPKMDRPISGWERRLFAAFPPAQEAFRRFIYVMMELRALNFVKARPRGGLAERWALAHIAAQIKDPALRAKVTPDYVIGCKRILISNDYYPALAQPHVRLITEAVSEIAPEGLRTASGLHQADVIIWATGFKPFEVLTGIAVQGLNGRMLQDEWTARGPGTYLGITTEGFPNLFFLMGPNTGLGHNSMIYMIESQIAHVMAGLSAIENSAGVLEVRAEAQSAFGEEIAAQLKQSVWGSGCKSWYVTPDGRNFTTWPGFTFDYRRRAKQLDFERYRLRGAGQ